MHLGQRTSVTLDVSAGIGGLAVRYDERFHVEVEAGVGEIVARAVVGDLVQEWSEPLSAPVLTLHIDCAPGSSALSFAPAIPALHLPATVEEERIALAEVDGRFLSSEVTESFTGRVIGVYVREGMIDATAWVAEGDDE